MGLGILLVDQVLDAILKQDLLVPSQSSASTEKEMVKNLPLGLLWTKQSFSASPETRMYFRSAVY
jgi:hypothetical protein